MCSFRTHIIYLLYLYMHIFNVTRLVVTVQAYIDRGANATGNICLAEDGIFYIPPSKRNVIVVVIIIRLILATLICITTVRSRINMTRDTDMRKG